MSTRRIVSLVPSVSETLCALGLQEDVVGCTSFCVHPKTLFKTAANVGGTKDASLEKILALQPTHVIVVVEENDAELVKTLKHNSSFETICYFPVEVADAIEMVEDLGKRFGKTSVSIPWAEEAQREADVLAQLRSEPISFCYFIWRDPWMVAGDKTFISKMLSMGGFSNQVVTSQEPKDRYPILKLDDKKALSSDVLMFSSEPFPFKQRHIDEFLALAKCDTRAIKVDGQMLSWYGTRTLSALKYVQDLRRQLHQRFDHQPK